MFLGRNNILNRRRYGRGGGGGEGGGMDRRKRLQRQTSVDYGLLHPILIDLGYNFKSIKRF